MKNNTPHKNKSDKIVIDFKVAIVIVVTLALFVLCAVGMIVSLAIDLSDSGSTSYISGGSSGGSGNSSVAQPSTPASSTSGVGNKTGIKLPCVTATGTYLSVSTSDTTDISADTDISSAAAVLVDITDNKTVAVKNADVRIYPASMTKVMTLLVACENAKDPNALLTVTADMVAKYNLSENAGASVAFTWAEGDQVTVEDALHMVIYKSDTYACWLLADYIAGGEEAFVTLMNNKAKSLGLTSTNFTNCTGLYNENHYTTCREMAAIMAAVMNNETATAVISKTTLYTADLYKGGAKTGNTVDMWSDWYTGRLETYRWGAAAAYYAGNGSDIKLIGGKTGWETIPTSCFVTAGVDDINGRKYVCVQVGRTDSNQTSIGSKVSTDDTRVIYQKYAKEKSNG